MACKKKMSLTIGRTPEEGGQMNCIFFKLDSVPVMYETSGERIYISAQDEWVEICDPLLRRMLQIETLEIIRKKPQTDTLGQWHCH